MVYPIIYRVSTIYQLVQDFFHPLYIQICSNMNTIYVMIRHGSRWFKHGVPNDPWLIMHGI
jgi:hypothetical protein